MGHEKVFSVSSLFFDHVLKSKVKMVADWYQQGHDWIRNSADFGNTSLMVDLHNGQTSDSPKDHQKIEFLGKGKSKLIKSCYCDLWM